MRVKLYTSVRICGDTYGAERRVKIGAAAGGANFTGSVFVTDHSGPSDNGRWTIKDMKNSVNHPK